MVLLKLRYHLGQGTTLYLLLDKGAHEMVGISLFVDFANQKSIKKTLFDDFDKQSLNWMKYWCYSAFFHG